MDDAALDWVASTLVHEVARGRTSPSAVLVLLHQYAASGAEALRVASEASLTEGLRVVPDLRDARLRTEWLGAFADASAVSDDERLAESVQQGLAETIDDLESLVRASYEPGEGLVGGSLADHIGCASALLTAFELTGRLPYSMLAEELVRAARRRWRSAESGTYPDDFSASCVAAQIECRLAALHRDPDYASSAVVAPNADYENDVRRAFASLGAEYRNHPEAAAEYGLAIIKWFALNPHPN